MRSCQLQEKWVEVEIITPSKISQTKEDTYHVFSLMCRIYTRKKKEIKVEEGFPGKRKGTEGEGQRMVMEEVSVLKIHHIHI
jgi:hypothetical protein